MGQKINPIGFRLSVNRNWASKWFANTKNFPGMLLEDIRCASTSRRSSRTPRSARS
jgi:hypothetical protein